MLFHTWLGEKDLRSLATALRKVHLEDQLMVSSYVPNQSMGLYMDAVYLSLPAQWNDVHAVHIDNWFNVEELLISLFDHPVERENRVGIPFSCSTSFLY